MNVSSDLLDYQDTIEIELINDRGKCIPNEEYRLRLSNGEIRRGKLDAKGRTKVEHVPAAGHRLEFPRLDQVFRTAWNGGQATTSQRGPAIRILPGFTRITHTKLIVFMDVGVWFEYEPSRGLAYTDFGLVSGNHVLRCSWMNMEHHPRKRWRMSQFSPAVREFFKKCPRDRGYIVDCERVTLPLVPEAELLVFLPDLHLSLFKQDDPKQYRTFSYDTFRHNARYWLVSSEPEYRSLEGELVQLLKAADHAKEIIQVGDCFEMWVAQALLIEDHMCLTKLYAQQGRLRPPLEKMWKEKKMLPRKDMQEPIDSFVHAAYQGDWLNVSYGISESEAFSKHVDRFGISILSTKAVRQAIIGKYPQLFKSGIFPFRWLCGNHDNMLTNDFYSNEGIKDYPITGDPGERKPSFSGGNVECIWAEHGHRLDAYNADDTFDQQSRGFGRTRGNAFSQDQLRSIKETEPVRTIVELIYDPEQSQRDQLKRLLIENANLRLVVMGHSHHARLEQYTLVESTGKRIPARFNEGVAVQPEEKERRGPWTSIQ